MVLCKKKKKLHSTSKIESWLETFYMVRIKIEKFVWITRWKGWLDQTKDHGGKIKTSKDEGVVCLVAGCYTT